MKSCLVCSCTLTIDDYAAGAGDVCVDADACQERAWAWWGQVLADAT